MEFWKKQENQLGLICLFPDFCDIWTKMVIFDNWEKIDISVHEFARRTSLNDSASENEVHYERDIC